LNSEPRLILCERGASSLNNVIPRCYKSEESIAVQGHASDDSEGNCHPDQISGTYQRGECAIVHCVAHMNRMMIKKGIIIVQTVQTVPTDTWCMKHDNFSVGM
jgi:hypothetical protein